MFREIIKESGIINSVHNFPSFNDEPKLYNFFTKINHTNNFGDGRAPDPNSSGVSFNEKSAFLKAFFEAIERYSTAYYLKKDFIRSSFNKIKTIGPSLQPSQFCYFSKKQLQKSKFSNFSYSNDDKFYWTTATSSKKKKVHVPSQLIYCPYKYNDEKTICLPITTGAALALSLNETLYKSVCEIIERDSFSTTYLLKLKPKRIVYSNVTSKISSIHDISHKYNLTIESYLLHSDFNIPTVMSIIFDKKYNLPTFSLGLKTDYCFEEAIVGSIEESFQSRYLIKTRMLLGNFKGSTYTERILFSRCKRWLSPSTLKYLNFIRKDCGKKLLDKGLLRKKSRWSSSVKLDSIKRDLKKKNLEYYYKDVTHGRVKKYGIFVTKVLIPDLNPLTLDFEYPYFGGRRLTSMKSKHKIKILNTRPHPFL